MDKAVLNYLTQHAWLLEEQTMRNLAAVLERHACGVKLDAAEIQAIAANAPYRAEAGGDGYRIVDGVAIVSVDGVLAKHSYMVNGASQPRGTSTLAIAQAVRAAADNPDVKAILLDVYSPGGSVEGVSEAADAVYAACDQKPVYAHANDLMASGAYFIASQADKVFTTAMGIVGSIGAYTVITDSSKAAEQLGLKVHVVKSGDMKGAGVPGSAVSEEQLSAAQSVINDITGLFVNAVARGRGISVEAAQKLADGRVHVGEAAVKLGLADKVQSFDDTLAQIINKHGASSPGIKRISPMARTKTTTNTAAVTAPQVEGNPPAGDEAEDEAAPPTTAAPDSAASSPDPVKTERDRCSAINAAFPDDPAFATKAIVEGMTLTEAKAAHYDTIKAKAAKPATAKAAGVKPLETSNDGNASATAEDPGAAFRAEIAKNEAAGFNHDKAVSKAAREHPDLRNAWVKAHNESNGRKVA